MSPKLASKVFVCSCVLLLFGAPVTPCDGFGVDADGDDVDDVYSLLQAEVTTRTMKRVVIPEPRHPSPDSKTVLLEELKADLSTGCAAEFSLPDSLVAPPAASANPEALVAEAEAHTLTTDGEAEYDKSQERLEQVMSVGLRLSLQAAVLAILVDGIRRYLRRGKEDAASDDEDSKEDELLRAALDGDMDCCKAMLQSGTGNVLAEDMWGCTPLHAVATRKVVDSAVVASKLLQGGANVHARDAMDETPLHFAARAGNIEVGEVLLAYGARLDCINAQELTPLLVSARAGQEDACKFFLGRGARVTSPDMGLDAIPMSIQELLETAMEADTPSTENDFEDHDKEDLSADEFEHGL